MRISKYKSIFLTLILLLSFVAVVAAAPPDVITTDELYRGMRGYGKTVIAGTRIETFNVEVVDVMRGSGPTGGDLILVKVSGDVIDRAGGIAQGMSGSPVFFNGRLAGAVAYGWALSQPDIGMLTPIGDMLKVSDAMRADLTEKARLEAERKFENEKEEAFELSKLLEQAEKKEVEDTDKNAGKKTVDKKKKKEKQKENNKVEIKPAVDEKQPESSVDENETSEQPEQPEQPQDSLLAMFPKGTAVMAAGFSERGLAMVKEGFKDYEIVPYNVGNVPYSMTDVKLEPGSGVSVELIRGDVSLGVIGTVTWVDGDEVIAFGHPFTRRGNVNFFMSNSYTFTTVSSINSSFKVGAPGKLLGVALQDRGAGLGGQLNFYPDVIPMLITVNDKARGINRVYAVQILQDDIYAAYLAQAAVVSLVERTIDRKGEGTGKVTFTIRGNDMPDGRELKRSNMFYSSANVSEILANEMATGVQLLKRNRFKAVTIADVHINVDVSDTRDTATILSARPLVKTVRPGQALGVEVLLQPFRGEQVTRIVNFVVPKDQKAGQMPLSVRGGTSLVSLQNVINQQNAAEMAVLLRQDSSKFKSFKDELDDFNRRNRNNDIVVDLFPSGYSENTKKKSNRNIEQVREEEEKQLAEFVQGTRYKTNTAVPFIVTGETTTVVEVIDPDDA